MSALSTVARKSFNGKFTAKIDFPDRAFYVTIANADIGSLKSLHTLFDKYLDHMLVKFEQTSYGPNHTKFCAIDKEGCAYVRSIIWLEPIGDLALL